MIGMRSASYAMAVVFWLFTAFYALLTSRDFIYQQFLQPELLPPLAWFARYWPAVTTVIGALWFAPRSTPSNRPHFSTWLTIIVWSAAAIAGWAGYSLGALVPGGVALICAAAACAMLVPIAIAERPDARATVGDARPHTATDFCACLLAAVVFTLIDGAIALFGAGPSSASGGWLIARGPLLTGLFAFLVLTLVRGLAGLAPRRLGACFGAFVDDLKARGVFDHSIVIVTSDHGDSLGEEGRMGHAYTLYPEIARAPLIVPVPAALRDRFAWDLQRPAYTTDLTPTLHRLLGHDPVSPAPFFGESLAALPGVPRPPVRSRMIAASYGSVYGALLDGATRLYVVDAIQRREMAFAIPDGSQAGSSISVTAGIRRDGGGVIRETVEAIARQYQFTPSPR